MLCSQSEYFANALEGSFSEGNSKELVCPAEREPAYLRMLEFLYTGDYSHEKFEVLNQEGARIYHVRCLGYR